MLSTLTSAVCSIFSYDAFSYSIPQLSQASINASGYIFPVSILLVLLLSGCSLIALQMRRVVAEDVNMSAIDRHNLNQKGKPPEESNIYISTLDSSIKYKPKDLNHYPSNVPFAKLNDHQKTRRRVYSHFEADDPKWISLKDIAIEHDFNQIILRNSKGSLKELPTIQPSSPLAFEQCSQVDLIKRAVDKSNPMTFRIIQRNHYNPDKLKFSLLKSIIKI